MTPAPEIEKIEAAVIRHLAWLGDRISSTDAHWYRAVQAKMAEFKDNGDCTFSIPAPKWANRG